MGILKLHSITAGMPIMKKVKLSLVSVLVAFGGFSTWVMWQVGYSGIWLAGLDNPASLQILLDLVIACTLICTWMYQDAKSRGIKPYPWIIATLFSGTLAPLVYLIVRVQTPADNGYEGLNAKATKA